MNTVNKSNFLYRKNSIGTIKKQLPNNHVAQYTVLNMTNDQVEFPDGNVGNGYCLLTLEEVSKSYYPVKVKLYFDDTDFEIPGSALQGLLSTMENYAVDKGVSGWAPIDLVGGVILRGTTHRNRDGNMWK